MYPWLVGSADGVDTVHRDKANRQVLAIELATTSAEMDRIDAEMDQVVVPNALGQQPDRSSLPGPPPFAPEDSYLALGDRRESLVAKLDFLTEVHSLVQSAAPGDGKGKKIDRYLVLLDPDVDGTGGLDQTGRAAVAWGNPDKATNVDIVVPGMNTFASDGGDLRSLVQDAGNLYATTDVLFADTPGKSVATVAWIGYDAPGSPLDGDLGVVTDKMAHEGAFSLAAYEWGLEEAHLAETGKSPTTTTLAHFYESVVAGAAIHHDNPSDNLVVFGSPGTTVDRSVSRGSPAVAIRRASSGSDLPGHRLALALVLAASATCW